MAPAPLFYSTARRGRRLGAKPRVSFWWIGTFLFIGLAAATAYAIWRWIIPHLISEAYRQSVAVWELRVETLRADLSQAQEERKRLMANSLSADQLKDLWRETPEATLHYLFELKSKLEAASQNRVQRDVWPALRVLVATWGSPLTPLDTGHQRRKNSSDAFELIQRGLEALGEYSGPFDGNPQTTHQALEAFQRKFDGQLIDDGERLTIGAPLYGKFGIRTLRIMELLRDRKFAEAPAPRAFPETEKN